MTKIHNLKHNFSPIMFSVRSGDAKTPGPMFQIEPVTMVENGDELGPLMWKILDGSNMEETLVDSLEDVVLFVKNALPDMIIPLESE